MSVYLPVSRLRLNTQAGRLQIWQIYYYVVSEYHDLYLHIPTDYELHPTENSQLRG